jgi:chromate transporter
MPFLHMGFTSFGGPAVHIAMMRQQFVQQRKWLSEQHFLDLLGAANLIPGPNSTEVAMHIGLLRAGLPGMFLVALCFIGPAVLLTTILAWAYVQFGSLPAAEVLLFGLKPAVVAVIAVAVCKLGLPLFRKNHRLLLIAVAVMAASLSGVNELVALLAGGLLGMSWLRLAEARHDVTAPALLPMLGPMSRPFDACFPWISQAQSIGPTIGPALAAPVIAGTMDLLWPVSKFFLQVGSAMYGGGYVLVAIMQDGLVEQRHWLTQQQLFDAVAAGQVTPGPVFSTAAFVGYVVGAAQPGAHAGHAAIYALLAAAAIFLPAFFFVPLMHAALPHVRKWAWTAAFLDAINASSVALMASVVVTLFDRALLLQTEKGPALDYRAATVMVLVVAGAIHWRSLNTAWLLLAGALLGVPLLFLF